MLGNHQEHKNSLSHKSRPVFSQTFSLKYLLCMWNVCFANWLHYAKAVIDNWCDLCDGHRHIPFFRGDNLLREVRKFHKVDSVSRLPVLTAYTQRILTLELSRPEHEKLNSAWWGVQDVPPLNLCCSPQTTSSTWSRSQWTQNKQQGQISARKNRFIKESCVDSSVCWFQSHWDVQQTDWEEIDGISICEGTNGKITW